MRDPTAGVWRCKYGCLLDGSCHRKGKLLFIIFVVVFPIVGLDDWSGGLLALIFALRFGI